MNKRSMELNIKHLSVEAENKEILHDINLEVHKGSVHAIMGPNGSGKSSLLYALMGHPAYKISAHAVKTASIKLNGTELSGLSTDMRAKRGLFLALQSPLPIPGVSVVQILRAAMSGNTIGENTNTLVKSGYNPALLKVSKVAGLSMAEFTRGLQNIADDLKISRPLLNRGIHDGFSGGERKKIEVLEALMVKPRVALFDEIDTGLDVDSLKVVGTGINRLKSYGTTVLIVTHYQRILKYVIPDVVHVLSKGKIVASGGTSLAGSIDRKGYSKYV